MTSPPDVMIHMGDKVLMPCHAVGDPEPKITWMFNSHKLNVPDDDSSNYKILPNGSLKIDQVHLNDVGEYECMASNIVGSVLSRKARMVMEETSSNQQSDEPPQLHINDPRPSQLVFVSTPQNTVVKINESIVLHCDARGE